MRSAAHRLRSSGWSWTLLLGVCLLCQWPAAGTQSSPVGPIARLFPGWVFSGELDADFSLPLRLGAGSSGGRIRLSFHEGGFSNPQETMLAEGLVGSMELEAVPRSRGGIGLRGRVVLTGGEVLLDRWYLKIDSSPLKLDFACVYDARDRSLNDLRGSLAWGETVRVQWEGSLAGLGQALRGVVRAELEIPSLAKAFDLTAGPILGETGGRLRGAEVGGRSRCSGVLEIHGSGVRFRGELAIRDTSVLLPSMGVEIRGMAGRIPLDLPVSGKTDMGVDPQGGARRGWVGVKAARLGKLVWDEFRIDLVSGPNSLALAAPLVLPMFGGRLLLKEMTAQPVFPLPPALNLALRLDDIDLEALSRAYTPYRVEGTLGGTLREVAVAGGALRSKGELWLDVWGGRISVQRLRGERIYSKRRRLGFDVILRGLDLESATRSLKFGQMGGILEGSIRGLSFAFGQPESFELDIRTVKRRGVRQYIDAKAVENLSIISAGAEAPLLPWFKFYPYSRLGIYCKLENDFFTLKGTIVEGGTEYLVKRSFLRGINVINRNPDNRIPWKDMVRRIQRIRPGKGEGVRVRMGP